MPRKARQPQHQSSQPSPRQPRKRLQAPQPDQPLIRPSEVARLVQEKIQNSPAAVGRLDAKRIGLLLEFTKFLFKCPRAVIAIEAHDTFIHLAPVLSPDGEDVFMTQEQWNAARKTFEVDRHERDLPAFMGIKPYTVEFIREIRDPEANK